MADRTEWLEARRSGIGGSDAAAAVGISPWVTPFQLYLDKTEGCEPVESDAMHWGTVLEPVIRREYAEVTGRDVLVPEKAFHWEKWPIAFAHVDGLARTNPLPRLIECKTARSDRDWGEPGTDEIPDHYMAQVQHCLMVLGLEVADVAVLFGGSDFRLYEVPADRELQELIADAEREFWACVEKRQPPEPMNPEDVRRRWPVSMAAQIECAPEHVNAYQRLRKLGTEIAAAQAEADELKSRLQALMGEADTLTFQGATLATWKSAKAAKRVDLEALKKHHPTAYADCLVEGRPSRRFLLKGPAEL